MIHDVAAGGNCAPLSKKSANQETQSIVEWKKNERKRKYFKEKEDTNLKEPNMVPPISARRKIETGRCSGQISKVIYKPTEKKNNSYNDRCYKENNVKTFKTNAKIPSNPSHTESCNEFVLPNQTKDQLLSLHSLISTYSTEFTKSQYVHLNWANSSDEISTRINDQNHYSQRVVVSGRNGRVKNQRQKTLLNNWTGEDIKESKGETSKDSGGLAINKTKMQQRSLPSEGKVSCSVDTKRRKSVAVSKFDGKYKNRLHLSDNLNANGTSKDLKRIRISSNLFCREPNRKNLLVEKHVWRKSSKFPDNSVQQNVTSLKHILGVLDCQTRNSVNNIKDPIRKCNKISSIHLGEGRKKLT